MTYRADLDGIRAVAVFVVVLFHLEVGGFRGGYVGVDVFFVLSGFLITSLIMTKVDQRSFRMTEFYLRRIRRLVPSLIATVAATLIVALVVLTPSDMVLLSRSAVAASGSLSNVLFYGESGYWDAAAQLKPLLHTWSLGVEEQFYLVWPALVIVLCALRRLAPFAVSLAAVCAVGFAAAVWAVGVDQFAAFYLFPFRVWQFGLGALVGSLAASRVVPAAVRPSIRDAVFVCGLALVGFAVFGFDGSTLYPGWNALLPTAGAMLMIIAGSLPGGQGGLGSAVLENPVSVRVGKLSYALYLAHWPIVALYRYEFGLELRAAEQVVLAAGIVCAALLLHHGVERRFYRRSADSFGRVSDGRFALNVMAVSVSIAVVGLVVWQDDGWEWRFSNLALTTDEIEAGRDARFDLVRQGCSLTRLDDPAVCDLTRPTTVLVVGNSHEPDGYNFLFGGFGSSPEVTLISFGTTNGCGGIESVDGAWSSGDGGCQERLNVLFDPSFVSQLDVVLYAANKPFADNKTDFTALLRSLRTQNPALKTLTFGGYINTDVPCARLIIKSGSGDACVDEDHVVYFESDPTGEPLYAAVMEVSDHYIDRVGLSCGDRTLATCATHAPGGAPFSYDEHHLSLPFALDIGRQYADLHPDLLSSRADEH